MSKKERKPGRRVIECVKCLHKQSTHSTNRIMCHVCLPPCNEIHYFKGLLKPKPRSQEPIAALPLPA